MVHNLRGRKICTSSPDCCFSSLNIFASLPDLKSFHQGILANHTNVIASPGLHSKNNRVNHSKNDKSKSTGKRTSVPTLVARIVIFKQTYKRKGGISLYAIKKHLNAEYDYNIYHGRKLIRNYIVESLANGNLKLVTNRGACGSVRLSRNKQRKFVKAQAQNNFTLGIPQKGVIVKLNDAKSTSYDAALNR